MRNFPAHQLAETENELASLAFNAERLSWDIGEHSDGVHWRDEKPWDASEWIAEIQELRDKLNRAEGLLRAYELFRKARQGESNDYASAG